jgi:hypothetical protein
VNPVAAIDEGQSDDLLPEDSEDLLSSKDKWECTYCYKKECYHAKHKKKDKAKDKCEDDHHGKHCYFKKCEKTH